MNRLDLYLGKSILSATLLAGLVVAVLEAAFTFLGQLGDIGDGEYGLGQALQYSLLVLPARVYQSFPMIVLLGALIGLGGLAARKELDVFRLAGCSDSRLVRSVLITGLPLILLVYLLGEGLVPPAWESATRLRTTAMYEDVQLQGGHEFWVRSGNRFILVDSTTVDGHLADLTVFEVANGARLKAVLAVGQARFEDSIWHLQDILETRFSKEQVLAQYRQGDRWSRLMNPELASLLWRDPRGLTLPELARYMDYLKGNGADISVYRLSWWQRLAAPVSVLAMLLLSLGFVLCSGGPRKTGRRVLTGIFVGLAFKLVNDISAHAGLVYGMPPYVSALLPSLLVLLPALGMMPGAAVSRLKRSR